jgi:hypothetical protein
LAVADRTDSNSQVEIDVELSTGGSSRLMLALPRDAITVEAEDIDHDGDVDVVVTRILTRDVVAVFLNDRWGQFTSASPISFPSRLQPIQVVRSSWLVDMGRAVVGSRRPPLVRPCVAAVVIVARGSDPAVRSADRSAAVFSHSVVGSRAPPSSL